MDNGQEQSGLHRAYHAARTANDSARIAKAAASSGLEGAAVETAKAALPRIIKIALGIAVLLITIPMAIFISLPHVFFGFFHSVNPPVTQVTEQAMELGNVCMSLEEFQNTVNDSIITAIVNSYEQAAVHIDVIQIENHFEEDDLLWFISINSVANKQNLDEISVDKIKELCADKLDYRSTIPEIPGLGLWASGHAGIYIGGGCAIEAMGTRYGVVKTQVSKRNWKTWYKIPSITYYVPQGE